MGGEKIMIIFSIIYLLFLCSYFVTRVGKNKKYRIINKYILASMYLVYAIVMFFIIDLDVYHYIMLMGLFFTYLGDILLVFDVKKGGLSFLLSNLIFATLYIVLLNDYSISFFRYFWIFIIWAIIIVIGIILINRYPNVIKLEKMKYPMIIYLSSITLHGLLGLVTLTFINVTPIIVMGIGSILFMISDYILTIDRFIIKNNKWIIRSNSLTYFIGLLLIVLSLGF